MLAEYIRILQSADSVNHLFPIVAFAGESVWITRHGDLVMLLGLRGVYSSLMTDAQLRDAAGAYERAKAQFPEDYRVNEYFLKRRLEAVPMRGAYDNEAVDEAVRNRAAFLKAKGNALYETDIYIGVNLLCGRWFGANTAINLYRRVAGMLWQKDRLEIAEEDLERNIKRIRSRVASFAKQIESLAQADILDREEGFHVMARLWNLSPGRADAMRMQSDIHIDEQCTRSNFDFDKDTNTLRQGTQRVCVYTLREGHKQRSIDVYRQVRELPANMIICSEWQRESKAASRMAINLKKWFHYGRLFDWYGTMQQKLQGKNADPNVQRMDLLSDEESEGNIRQLKVAKSYLLDEGNCFGHYNMTVVLYGPNGEDLGRACTNLEALLDEKETVGIEETFGGLLQYASMLPGNYALSKRKRLRLPITASAECSPIYAVPKGAQRNRHLQDEYLLAVETNHNTIYYLNLHDVDVLTALVIGAQGSGKTFCLQTIVTMYAKYGGYLCLMDIVGNFRDVVEQLGGVHTSVVNDRTQLRLNPFSWYEGQADMSTLETLASMWIGEEMTAEEQDEVRQAIRWTVSHQNRAMRRLKTFASYLTGRVGSRMLAWVDGIFDNEEDMILTAQVMSFDFSGLQHDQRLMSPVVFYITQVVDREYRRVERLHLPKLLVLDEVFILASHPAIADYVIEFPKVARNFNGGILLASQSALDFDKLGPRALVFETFKTHLVFPTRKMNAEAYQERLGLNDREARAASEMTPKQQFLLRKGDEPSVILNLNVDERTRLMLSTVPRERQERIRLTEQYGLKKALDLMTTKVKEKTKAVWSA